MSENIEENVENNDNLGVSSDEKKRLIEENVENNKRNKGIINRQSLTVIGIVILGLLSVSLYLIGGNKSKQEISNEISAGYENINKSNNSNKDSDYVPPPIDKFDQKVQEIKQKQLGERNKDKVAEAKTQTKQTNVITSNDNNNSGAYIPPKIEIPTNPSEVEVINVKPFAVKDTDTQNLVPDISSQNAAQIEQAEIIKEITKQQKPDDMIAFLKEIQNKFDFLKSQQRFKYEMKNYEVGDIFLWWEIEEITSIYIRFKDGDYSYNLRFLEN